MNWFYLLKNQFKLNIYKIYLKKNVPKENNIYLFFLINIKIIFISCSKQLIELELDLVKCGSLRNEEYDYYILSLPD